MTKLSPWLRLFAVLMVGLAPLLAGLAWIQTQVVNDPPPTLETIVALARGRQLDEARNLLAVHLKDHPDDSRGHLMMAQFLIDRAEPQPRLALEHLQEVRETTPEKQALVEFFKGKAHYQDSRYDRAEDCWVEALRLNPTVPEAGAALLNLYELEGRLDDAHGLGMRLHEVEPDARDRVGLLLTVGRLDLNKPSPESQVKLFGPLLAAVPGDLKIATTVGLALIRDSKAEPGLEILRKAFETHKDSSEAWDALLKGLDEAGQPAELAKQLAILPTSMSHDPRFAKHRGQVAQNDRDWKTAAEAFRVAFENDPRDVVVLYRLSRALRLAGDSAESQRIADRLDEYQAASKQLTEAVERALAIKTLGLKPEPDLYQELADLRERMGRSDEARAWHRLVLRDDPNQAISLAAIERLK